MKNQKESSQNAEISDMTETDSKRENYYVFGENLKSIFQNPTQISFGIEKSNALINENDSSELAQTEINLSGSDFKSKNKTTPQEVTEPSKKIRSWKEYFFFLPDDVRLSDGVHFFSDSYELPNSKFDELRKNLKIFVRNKISKKKSLKIKKKKKKFLKRRRGPKK